MFGWMLVVLVNISHLNEYWPIHGLSESLLFVLFDALFEIFSDALFETLSDAPFNGLFDVIFHRLFDDHRMMLFIMISDYDFPAQVKD